jgi:protease YdgD
MAWPLLALVAAATAPAWAQQDLGRGPGAVLRPGIGTADPRQAPDPEALPWRALGRVQTEIGGRCTGVLVGPRHVLTAAHCLAARQDGQFVQPRSVHFLLGYHQGRWRAHGRAAELRIGAGFSHGGARMGPAGADWAMLVLEGPIGSPADALPMLGEVPPPRTPLMLGGYQQDRPEMLLADTGCRALGTWRAPSAHVLLVHDCAGTRGVSGAPLLARQGDGSWAVAGVAVAAVHPDLAMGLAVPAASIGPPQ